jgi:PAS domain S-box-containing protein
MDKELRILILEDVPDDAELEEHELRKAGLVFISQVVDTREAFLKALEEFSPDLILADYDLPTFDGLTALEIVKKKCPDVPFILVTGRVGEEFAIETLKKGANDYVMKNNLKRLVPVINRAVEEAKHLAERKQVVKKLRETQDLIQSITNNLMGAMVYQVCRFKDGTRRFTYLSDAVETLYGCTPQDAIANPNLIYGKVHPDDRLRVFQEEEEANKELSTFRTEIRVLCPSGAIRWSSFVSTPRTVEDGTTIWDGIEFDITERKQAEKAIVESEERYRLLFNNVSDAIILHEISPNPSEADRFRIIEANDIACQYLGYTREELLQMDVRELDAPEAQGNTTILNTIFTEGRATWEGIHIHKYGHKIPVEITNKLFNLHGKSMALASARDITERKRAEKLIDDALSFNKTILETSPIGIITYRASGQCVSVNESIANMIGGTVDQLSKQNFYHLESWKKSGMLALAEEALASGIEKRKDVYVVSTFGKEVWFVCRFVPFQFGDEPHLLALFTDITDRKKAEEEIHQRVKELEDFYTMAVGRELRMMELKEQIESLKEELEQYKKQ